jgi:hypothetical protein
MSKKRLDYNAVGLHKITKSENPTAYKAKQFVVKATGEVISGAKARKLAGSTAPSRQPKSARKATTRPTKPNTQYTNYISRFVDRKNRELKANNLNPNFTRGEARTDPVFKRAYANLKREGSKKKVDRSAQGPLAEALEDLGLREENADYPVGETPD